MPKPPDHPRDFNALRYITECLRGEEGCPWDKEQTHASLTRFAIEEAFELAEAIESGNSLEIQGELGDLLFQVMLHSEIASQEGRFTLDDVIETLAQKMVRRHPHVFSNVSVKDSQEVLKNWSEIKKQEKGAIHSEGPFPTPKGLPALLESFKIGEKTKALHFDWGHAKEVFEKVEEEIRELKIAIEHQSPAQMESELGDVLFSLSQLARHLKIDPEQSLRKTNARFRRRFQSMLDTKPCTPDEFKNLSAEEKERLWMEAKTKEALQKR